MKYYLGFDIGCLECGEASSIVLVSKNKKGHKKGIGNCL